MAGESRDISLLIPGSDAPFGPEIREGGPKKEHDPKELVAIQWRIENQTNDSPVIE